MMKVCIIDILGTPYDGSTLKTRGLGGSESAVILMSRELVKLGFNVTVLNNCIDNKTSEGIYDGVVYRDVSNAIDEKYDVVISSRSILPFAPEKYWDSFNPNPQKFKYIKDNAKLKILWMHDTFCNGDHLLEELVINGDIDELFTLSDFHTTYVTNCNHGRRRNYEVLKNKVFQTRNGITNYIKHVDIKQKDKNLFVYNSSATKGLQPLLNMWPEIKKHIPAAKLKVIGGYYRFKNDKTDAQYEQWEKAATDKRYLDLDIEFTGIIRQDEIAQILAKASFMIYPCIYPETFGISAMESLCYNTPLITTRFGALEETALEQASYLIDYAVEPNNLFQDIDSQSQYRKFIDTTVKAYNNPYLHQQKMYYCNIIKDVCEWDTVAIQWKQHIYKKLNEFLSAHEYRLASRINHRVQKVFGRRFSNIEQMYPPSSGSEMNINIISPFYNAEEYIQKCILSVAQQDYKNYTHFLIDDASTDRSYEIAKATIESLPEDIRHLFSLIRNEKNMGAVYNQVHAIKMLQFKLDKQSEEIVMLLDGDDWLVNDNAIFQQYNQMYQEGTEFTYGSCWSIVDNIPLIAQEYPDEVKQNRSYRQHRFNWNMPYTHLRTFVYRLFENMPDEMFKDENGQWLRAGGDGALFYSLIERADPAKIKVIQDIVYNYNDTSPLNDYKVNGEEQTKTAEYILKQNKMKKILIAIPTAKYIEPQTFKSIYDLEVPVGYETEFQYFYGYNIDQVRNLIAEWGKRYDYLFCVDSDIVLPKDSLQKMLAHKKDIVTGVYIQRKPGTHVLEIYNENDNGGFSNIPFENIKDTSLIEIGACGFGCVLIDSKVLNTMNYPHFLYKSALNHKDTFSEDLYFCKKARDLGFKTYCDTTIKCDHLGQTTFRI
jgi:glycosyltransferase involved in cell wall biosynthesis